MKVRKGLLFALLAAYLVFWFGGVASYALRGGPSEEARWAAPVFLLLAGLIVVVSSARGDWPALLTAVACGFAAEAIGVRYGVPFGAYRYTDALAPNVFGVPLVIACAWVVLVAYVRQLLPRVKAGRAAGVLIAAAWMMAIDLVIDPSAANGLGYWEWAKAGWYYGVPASNFAGWFVVSVIIFVADNVVFRCPMRANRWAVFTGMSIVVFFTLIALSGRLYFAAAVGLALLGTQVMLMKAARQRSTAMERLEECGSESSDDSRCLV